LPSLLVVAAAGALIAWRPEARRHVRTAAGIAVALLCFYGISLALLAIAEAATSADVGTKFQRGHTAVSLFWGLVGMGLLYVGLTRRRRELRLAGFGLLEIGLAKLFLYDSPFSAAWRARSRSSRWEPSSSSPGSFTND
jgi:uncharacterized membrane protein